MGAQFFHSWSSHLNMKAFICSALLAVASARPQLLSHGLVGHGVVGHAVAHPVVAHPVAHAVAHPVVAHAVAPRVVAHPVVAHPVAHAVASYNPGDLAEPSPYNYQYSWLTTTPALTSPSLRLTMELAPYLAPTLSTSPTAGSSTSTTKLTTSLEMLPPSPMTELPHTQTLSVLPTLSLDIPSPTL